MSDAMSTMLESDAATSERVLAVFAHYQRHIQKGSLPQAAADILIIAASLTNAHFACESGAAP